MKAQVNGVTVEGTPEEIARLLNLQKDQNTKARLEAQLDRSKHVGCTYDCFDPETGEWLGSI